MDTIKDTTTVGSWENAGSENGNVPKDSMDPSNTTGKADEITPEFYTELDLLRSVIKGQHSWSKYLDNTNFKDIKGALVIIYSYHPKNNGKDPELPKVTLGDIEQMREDMMHLSALNCFLAAQAAMYESNADNVEQERKLCRSLSWKKIRRDLRNGVIKERMTQDDIKHEAEADAAELYRMEYELRQLGRMFNWVRAAIRTFTDHLGILIQSAMREERGDARFR